MPKLNIILLDPQYLVSHNKPVSYVISYIITDLYINFSIIYYNNFVFTSVIQNAMCYIKRHTGNKRDLALKDTEHNLKDDACYHVP